MRYAEINYQNRGSVPAIVDCETAHESDEETLRVHLAEVHKSVLPTRTLDELREWHSPNDWRTSTRSAPAPETATRELTHEERVRAANHAGIRSLTPPALQWLAEDLIAKDPSVTVEGARAVVKAEFYRRKGQTVPTAQQAASVELTPDTVLRAFTSMRSEDATGPACSADASAAFRAALSVPAPAATEMNGDMVLRAFNEVRA